MTNYAAALAAQFHLKEQQTAKLIELIDAGNTIPFIARYRKEEHGSLDDQTIRTVYERLQYLRNLDTRKAEVRELIEGTGNLTPEIEKSLTNAATLAEIDDIYRPFRPKRKTRAGMAKERGLEPLAKKILAQEKGVDPMRLAEGYVNAEKGVNTSEDALNGAKDIIAETISDDAVMRRRLRMAAMAQGVITSRAAKDEDSVYRMYYEFSQPAAKIAGHRVLALDRGEREGLLKVSLEMDDVRGQAILTSAYVKGNSACSEVVREAAVDAYGRLIFPSIEREIRAELTEKACDNAIKVFSVNLRQLLMQPPVKGRVTIGLDPGYRTGCKVAVLDEYGKLLDHTTVYPTPPRSQVKETQAQLAAYVEKHRINVIVIGNGTGSRETEEVVADYIARSKAPVRYTIVNEAGASVYSASKLASEEYPDLDVTTRGAMSLGRRLQDPLAELVKIPPQAIGVGQYQHDLNQAALERALTGVVENVVNRVGVDLNTASASLLGYVSGISAAVAKNIVAYREEHGAFTDRGQLKKVPKLGAKAFQNCAGFLRISDGKNPLDATSVHPESYAVANELLKRAKVKPEALADGGVPDFASRLGDVDALAAELGVGAPTLRDIVSELEKPGRDPRDDAPEVVFSEGVRDFDDLTVGMELTGTVRNVVDFGAFVDVGVKQDGLVHVSKMADRFVRHPSEVVAVGDTVTVWVTGIDKDRGKISLSMVKGKA